MNEKIVDKINKLIETNRWVSGVVDYLDGDLTALNRTNDLFGYPDTRYHICKSKKELFEELKKNGHGIFIYKDMVFVKDPVYSTFVYDAKSEDGNDYIEHLDVEDMTEKEFLALEMWKVRK